MQRLTVVLAVLALLGAAQSLPSGQQPCWDWWNGCRRSEWWQDWGPSPQDNRPAVREVQKIPVDVNVQGGIKISVEQPQQASPVTAAPPNQKDSHGCTSYPCLVFEDNFNFLNHEVWEHELTAGGGGNWEFQYYTNNRTNSYVRDGILYIKPTLTSDNYGESFLTSGNLDLLGSTPADECTGAKWYGCQRQGTPDNPINPIQSARLRSSRGFNLRYGRVEVQAQMPTGDWIWPAIWLLPRYNAYGGWPASGEIDLVESRGNRRLFWADNSSAGVDSFGSTLHFGPSWQFNAYMKAHATTKAKTGTFGDRFHTFRMDWTDDNMRFFVDGEEFLKVDPGPLGFWGLGEFSTSGLESPWKGASKMAPFDQKFYMILNVAVGGMNYFEGTLNEPYPKPWEGANKKAFWDARDNWYPTWNPELNNGEDAALKINYVKVWKLSPDQF